MTFLYVQSQIFNFGHRIDILPIIEVPSLKKLIIYGNPLAHAAILPQDKTQLAYDPVPSMTYDDNDVPRDIAIVTAYPRDSRAASKRGSYESFRVRKLKNDNIPMVSEFRERGNRLLFSSTGEVLREAEQEVGLCAFSCGLA